MDVFDSDGERYDESGFTRTLNICANRTIDPEQARLGFRLLLSVLTRLPDPADVSFHYDSDESGERVFTIQLECMTETGADHNQATAIRIVRAITPWLDVEIGTPPNPTAADLQTVRFAIGTDEIVTVLTTASLLWTAVAQVNTAVRFSLRVQQLIVPNDETAEAQIRAEARLSAPPADIDALAALAGIDGGQRAMLQVLLPRHDSLRDELVTDIPTIARLLAGPFTVPAFNRPARPITAGALGDLIADAVPPHALLVGGSGQGKTTALEHLVDEAFARGSVTVVICPHGDLAERAVAAAVRRGIDPLVFDLGARPRHLHWNLTQPDEGTSATEWARRLAEVIRRQLWDSMPAAYFGPVSTRTLPRVIEALAADPAGPWPLTHIPALLDPTDSRFHDQVLRRIGDPELTRAINIELMPMLNAADPGNAAIWLISKFDQLIGDPTVRRIIETRHRDVSMQAAVEGRSIVVSLPQSVLSEEGASVLGALLVDQLWTAVRRRNDHSQLIEVFVDEWQKLPTPALPAMLAEGRKFGLRLRLANQHFAQLTPTQREAVLANTGWLATFRTSPSDAGLLDERFPHITPHQMQTLPRYTVAFTSGDVDGVLAMPAPRDCDRSDFARLAAAFVARTEL